MHDIRLARRLRHVCGEIETETDAVDAHACPKCGDKGFLEIRSEVRVGADWFFVHCRRCNFDKPGSFTNRLAAIGIWNSIYNELNYQR